MITRVELRQSSTADQLADMEGFSLSDFDTVTPAWDIEVNERADFDDVTDAENDMRDWGPAAHDGTLGLYFDFDNNAPMFGTMNADAINRPSGVVSFWFNPNNLALQDGRLLILWEAKDGGNTRHWHCRLNSDYSFDFYYRDDDGVEHNIGNSGIIASYSRITIMFKRATGAGHNNGFMYCYVGNSLKVSATGLDNDTRDWDFMNIGMIWTSSTTYGGAYFIDSIKIDPVGGPMSDKLAAMTWTYGMVIPIMDTTSRFAAFTDPDDERGIFVEWMLNPVGMTMANDEAFHMVRLMSGGGFTAIHMLHKVGAEFRLLWGYYTDANVWTEIADIPFTSGVHRFRFEIVLSSEVGANDGYARCYIDNVLVATATGLDNDTKVITDIHFGALAGIDAGTYGFIQMDNCRWGPWVDLTSDVQTSQYVHSRGISGYQPTNRVASPGKFTFLLNNTVLNSGGVAGYYSPEHSSVRPGFETSAEIRIQYTSNGTYGHKWRGRIHRIEPDPGPFKYTKVTAYDWMKDAQDQKFKAITTATERTVDQAIVTILASMPDSRQPAATSLAVGKSTFPYVFDSERTEKTSVMAVFQKLALTEMGNIYISSGAGDGEQLVFTNRDNVTEETAVKYYFGDDIVSVNVLYPADAVKTRVITIVFPRETDANNIILAQSIKPFNITSDASRTMELLFRDLTTADRISASSTVTPLVASTDYIANAQSDGGGADLTGDTTVTVAEESGNSIKLLCEYAGGGTAWLTTLQIRGKGIYTYDPVTYTAEDSDAQEQYGDKILRYSMPYEDDFNVAVAFGDYLLSVWKDPILQLRELTYYPEESDALTRAFFNIDIGKRISVSIAQLGIDVDYFVRKETVRRDKGKLKVSYGLEPAGSSAWMKLNDDVYGKLDAEECRLSV